MMASARWWPSKMFDYLETHRPLPNVGALARLRSAPRVPLLPFAKLKPAFVVRTPREFQTQFLIWIALYLAAFHAVFLIWRWSAFRGDFAILPAIHLLTGIGLILAVSLRDPLRDTLEFSKFAWGVALGCVVLLLPSLRILNYQRFAAWCYTPLFGSARAVRFVAAIRLGARRQRREGESGAVPAGGGDQDSAGVFPGRLLRAQLGAAARFAREASGPAFTQMDRVAAAWRMCYR